MQQVHKRIPTKSRKFCSVPQCSSYCTQDISLHKFPTSDSKLCKQWQHQLKIGKNITKYMQVCSKHFQPSDFFLENYSNVVTERKRLKKGVVPSQNLPVSSIDKNWKKETKTRRSKWYVVFSEKKNFRFDEVRIDQKREKEKTVDFSEQRNYGVFEENIDVLNQEKIKEKKKPLICVPSAASIDSLQSYSFTEDKATQTDFDHFSLSVLLNNDKKLNSFTGINRDTLTTFTRCSENVANACGGNIDNLQRNIILVLCKLKLNISFTCLAVLFNIRSNCKCGDIFYETVSLLACAVKPAIYWPTKEEVLRNMPKCFQRFQNTRVVLDCTEIKIQKFKCLKSRVMSYSHYKGCHTAKFLIGIAPFGLISYVSPAYGGRASDKNIFNQENLILQLDAYDAVMVDKGVTIRKECEDFLVTVYQPPFLREKKQLSKSEAQLTAAIARARVHVERAIQRIKIFKIFHEQLNWNMIPYIDDIMTVIAGSVNLSAPILASNKFF